ncbi:hypothetical protein FOZ63_001982 [Perkinsus olseni]|uniref:Zinc transporter n=1 Tax=Perkinsus olseni TaxID=32597 RepID=A0A7J6UIW0_PEROL|nr:hypothetical protein FOZ63_001982 [Perkinsus olseni]
MDSIEVWKLLSIFTTFAVAAVGMWVSFYFRKSKLFALGCALACGVLLAVGLTHSLPEGVEGLEAWSEDNLDGYPFAYLLCAVAIAFLAILEEGVHVWFERRHSLPVCEHGPSFVGEPLDASRNVEADKQVLDPHMHPDVLLETSAVFVFLALSVHSILEGMATGVASDVDHLYGTLIAILAHKGLAAFALGASMVEADVALYRVMLYGAIFALGTPVGILIGWFGSRGEDSAGLFGGVVNALAAGTFIYVSTMEFMPITFKHDRSNFIFKILMFIAGFSLMAILPIWGPEGLWRRLHSIHLPVVVVGVEGKGRSRCGKEAISELCIEKCCTTSICVQRGEDNEGVPWVRALRQPQGPIPSDSRIYSIEAEFKEAASKWLKLVKGDFEGTAGVRKRVPKDVLKRARCREALIVLSPTLIAIIPSPALFPSYQSPVVGDRLMTLEGQVRNLQVQVNSLCISQPATETVPDDASPQDERVLSEIQQLRSTVALLCDELKKVSAKAQQQQEGDVPSPPLTAPVEESSHGEGQKLEREDEPGVLGSPTYPPDPQPQQHAADGDAPLEDKGVVPRPARSSVTSLPSPRPSSDVKEGCRRSASTSVHLSPRGSIERRGSLAHRLSSPRVKGSRLFVSPENPAWGMTAAAGRSPRRASTSSSAPGPRATRHGSVSEGVSTLVPYDNLVDEAYARINALYGSLGACVDALCTGEGTFDTSTRFECLDFAAIIEQVGMTPKEGCRLFRILDTQRVGLVALEDLALAAAGKLPRRRSSVGLSRSHASRRTSTNSATGGVGQRQTTPMTMGPKAFAPLPPVEGQRQTTPMTMGPKAFAPLPPVEGSPVAAYKAHPCVTPPTQAKPSRAEDEQLGLIREVTAVYSPPCPYMMGMLICDMTFDTQATGEECRVYYCRQLENLQTPLGAARMFVPTAVAGIIILRDYYLNAQNKLAPMRSVTLQATTIVLLLLLGLGTMGLSLMTVHSSCPHRTPEEWARIARRTMLPVHIVMGITLGSAATLLWLARRAIERTDATEAKLE